MWGADTKDRPWPPGRAHQAQKPYPVTKELVLAGMKEAGVDRVVVVPPSWEGDRNDQRHPGLRLVIDHLAIGTAKKDDEAFAGLAELCALARRPNVAVKASALPCYTAEPYPYDGLHKHIRRVYDAFGPRRTFWGTDWTRLTCSWRQAITLFTEELPWLSAEDKEWIMGRAICEWLGWPMPKKA